MISQVENRNSSEDRHRRVYITIVVACALCFGVLILGQTVVEYGIGVLYPQSPTAPAPAPQTSGSIHHLHDPDPVIRAETDWFDFRARFDMQTVSLVVLIVD